MNLKKIFTHIVFENKYIRLIFIWFFVILFSSFSYNYNSETNFIKTIWNHINDSLLYSRSYEDKVHNNEVVIIKIDNRTLNELEWNTDFKVLWFSKKIYSDTIKNLIKNYDVNTIWIDVIFANKSNLWEEDELLLANTMSNNSDSIVIWSYWNSTLFPLCVYWNIQHWNVLLQSQDRIRKGIISSDKYWLDKKCNSKIVEWNQESIDSFWIEVYRKYLWNDYNLLKREQNLLKLEENLKHQKEINDGFLHINFSHNWESNYWTIWFKSYSLVDIYYNEEFDRITWEKIDLKDKIVLIWEVWTIFHDEYLTPISLNKRMSWVEIHANIITSILYNSYLVKLNEFLKNILSIIIVFSMIFFMIKTSNKVNIISLFVIFLLEIIIWLQLFSYNIIFPLSFYIYLSIITFIVIYIYKYSTSEENKVFLRKAFNMYLSPEMVDMIVKNHDELNLSWKKWEISIFFSDIVGFTTISEKLKAEKLLKLLNEYLSEMTKILTKNHGTLDKYIWDAIMWFYNAPVNVEKHEYKACITALQQMKKLDELNIKWKDKWYPKIDIRIWIHTWITIHWNVWAEWERINYTIIWDNVNLAARLEWVNKKYDTKICISENTYKKVKKDFIFRELDTIQVKWKNKWVKIFELIWENWMKLDMIYIINYEKGLNLYYKWEYKNAISEFEKNDNDNTSKILINRCKQIIKWELIVENWVFKMLDK